MTGLLMLYQRVGVQLRIAKGGHLGDPAAIFGADVEAGADLVRKAGSVEAADFSLLLHVQRSGAGVADGQEDEAAGPASTNGLKFLKTKERT